MQIYMQPGGFTNIYVYLILSWFPLTIIIKYEPKMLREKKLTMGKKLLYSSFPRGRGVTVGGMLYTTDRQKMATPP